MVWKKICYNTEKLNSAKIDFEKEFKDIHKNSIYRKTKENVRIKENIDFNRKDDKDEVIKEQSKLSFNGILQSYTNYDSYTFKQNEMLMDKPIYTGLAVLELSKEFLY